MKTIIYMAVSADGKTTGQDGDTSWVDDAAVERMDALMEECGVMIMGSKTFASFGDELPNEIALQVIMTSQSDLLNKDMENVIFTGQSPAEVLKMLQEKGFEKVMLAGGQKLNTSFLKANLIDEIWLIKKPLVLGEGKGLFSDEVDVDLKLLSQEKLKDGSVEIKYLVER